MSKTQNADEAIYMAQIATQVAMGMQRILAKHNIVVGEITLVAISEDGAKESMDMPVDALLDIFCDKLGMPKDGISFQRVGGDDEAGQTQ